jgi:hypothetical protein
MLDLMNVLNAAYDFVIAAEPLKKIESRKKCFEQLLKETNECAYFIREYVADRDFGECRFDSRRQKLITFELHAL